ncbi:DUF4160 domain-containing protein [Niabella ginsengisoli]|uniref:DUF4160 domain-containing protein n=1 Tax=Niabella ginsengisoli TaxID=522298 RepID=UPI00374DB42F
MPTILHKNGYRFFFYTNDHPPLHIHIERENKTAKFNLVPIELILSKRFNARELSEIRKLVAQHSELFKQKWNEYFNNN